MSGLDVSLTDMMELQKYQGGMLRVMAEHQSGRTVERDLNAVADIFMKAVGTPAGGPLKCGKAAYGCLHLFDKAGLSRDPKFLVEKRPDVLRAFVELFTRPPTVMTGKDRLLKSWNTCSCYLARELTQDIHVHAIIDQQTNRGSGLEETMLPGFIHPMASMLASALEPHVALAEKKAARNIWSGRSETWPSTLADVMPHGAGHTMQMLLEWISVNNNVYTTDVINLVRALILVIPGGATMSAVLSYPRLIEILQANQASILSNWDASPSKQTAMEGLSMARSLSSLIRTFVTAPAADIKAFIAHAGARLPAFMATGWRVVGALEAWGVYATHPSLALIKTNIRTGYSAGLATIGSMELRLAEGAQPADMLEVAGSAAVLRGPLHRLYAEGVCGRRGCGAVSVDGARPFARCGGCGVLRYCSRACQKEAWKDEACAHKDACGDVRALREQVFPPGVQPNVVLRTEYTFVAACRRLRVDREVVGRVSRHFCDVFDLQWAPQTPGDIEDHEGQPTEEAAISADGLELD